MKTAYDEITGLYIEGPIKPAREFWVVTNDDRYACSTHAKRSEAREWIMARGLRATHKVIEV